MPSNKKGKGRKFRLGQKPMKENEAKDVDPPMKFKCVPQYPGPPTSKEDEVVGLNESALRAEVLLLQGQKTQYQQSYNALQERFTEKNRVIEKLTETNKKLEERLVIVNRDHHNLNTLVDHFLYNQSRKMTRE